MKKLRFSQDPYLDGEIFDLCRSLLSALAPYRKDIECEYEKRREFWQCAGINGSVELLQAFDVPLPEWAQQ
jgi:hypothetical protein